MNETISEVETFFIIAGLTSIVVWITALLLFFKYLTKNEKDFEDSKKTAIRKHKV
jgi:hypothetical protein